MSISERLYIRWFPDEASEPTSTLVLTASNRRFVDLRLLKPTSPSPSDSAPYYTQLDWGFAGRSVGTAERGEWTHDIDSRTTEPEPDAGVSSPHPTMPDVSLERGRMRYPESGEMRDYEEAWRHVPVLPVGGPETHADKRVSVFLETGREGEPRRGMIARVGQYCQGIMRDGQDVSVQRWAWSESEGWQNVAKIGEAPMACDVTWSKELNEGDEVERDGYTWIVKAIKVW